MEILWKISGEQADYLRRILDTRPIGEALGIYASLNQSVAEHVAQHKAREDAKAKAMEAAKNIVPKRAAGAVLADLKRNGAAESSAEQPQV